ncbi:kinase binding protein CGI-121-domain-containing protein [Chaetomium sp. MPI-SDFR-AT-0129]|nr:kinase binding protein CGI-121-domain-containing protein [Chaetomium sp. MPI-SDFR-AT-0129]
MSLEKLHLEHIPLEYQVYLGLFRNVANADFLHKQLLSRNSEFEYAFIDASTIISRIHLLSAVYSAINSLLNGSLRTPNVHSEIVMSLNTNNNISDAYRRWGITPGKTRDLVVVKVILPPNSTANQNLSQTQTPDEQTIYGHLEQHVQGTPTPVTDEELAQTTDWAKVRKYYRLNGIQSLDKISDEREKRKQCESLVIVGMALRGL